MRQSQSQSSLSPWYRLPSHHPPPSFSWASCAEVVAGKEEKDISSTNGLVNSQVSLAVVIIALDLGIPYSHQDQDYLILNHFEEIHLKHACMLSHFSCVCFFAILWDSSQPGSSVHGILQARIWEWVAMSSSRGSS